VCEGVTGHAFCKNSEVLLGSGISSFGGCSESLYLLISVSAPNDFEDMAREAFDGHMFGLAR
jgi:hypothetical protein